jgi:hypothetical protein
MIIGYTYIYELRYENNNEVFYIGKTNNPYNRFGGHRSSGNFGDSKFYMKIIKKYIDLEDEIINIYINEGHKLLNVRKNNDIMKEYNVGETLTFDPYYLMNKMNN